MEAMIGTARVAVKDFAELVAKAAAGHTIGCADINGVRTSYHDAEWIVLTPDGALVRWKTTHKSSKPKHYESEYARIFYYEKRVLRGMMRPFLAICSGKEGVRVWTNSWQATQEETARKREFVRWLGPVQTYCFDDVASDNGCCDA